MPKTTYSLLLPSARPHPSPNRLPAARPHPDLTCVSAFLQLDRLLPPLMSCLLHIDFERRGDAAGAGGAGTGALSSLPPKWTHWKVRDYAAELLRAICDK